MVLGSDSLTKSEPEPPSSRFGPPMWIWFTFGETSSGRQEKHNASCSKRKETLSQEPHHLSEWCLGQIASPRVSQNRQVAGLALRCKHLPSNMSTGTRVSWKNCSSSGFSQQNLVNWSENEKSGTRKATNVLSFLILPEQAAALLKSENLGTPRGRAYCFAFPKMTFASHTFNYFSCVRFVVI